MKTLKKLQDRMSNLMCMEYRIKRRERDTYTMTNKCMFCLETRADGNILHLPDCLGKELKEKLESGIYFAD